MAKRSSVRRHDPREIVTEIVRRAGDSYVVRLSDPTTPSERLQLMAARLQRSPIVIMPARCKTVAEWMERYARRLARR